MRGRNEEENLWREEKDEKNRPLTLHRCLRYPSKVQDRKACLYNRRQDLSHERSRAASQEKVGRNIGKRKEKNLGRPDGEAAPS